MLISSVVSKLLEVNRVYSTLATQSKWVPHFVGVISSYGRKLLHQAVSSLVFLFLLITRPNSGSNRSGKPSATPSRNHSG